MTDTFQDRADQHTKETILASWESALTQEGIDLAGFKVVGADDGSSNYNNHEYCIQTANSSEYVLYRDTDDCEDCFEVGRPAWQSLENS